MSPHRKANPPLKNQNTVAVLGAIVSLVAITAAVVLLANDNSSSIAFLGVVTPTIVSLLALMKTETVQNQMSLMQTEVAELTNGKMNEAVNKAIENVVSPLVDEVITASQDDKADK